MRLPLPLFLGVSALFCLAADPGRSTPPTWLASPSDAQVAAAMPASAMRLGISGSVRLRCTVDTQGLLQDCVVVREHPKVMGFGQAALSLAPAMRFQPATKDGSPVADQITIPLDFDLTMGHVLMRAGADNEGGVFGAAGGGLGGMPPQHSGRGPGS